MEVEVAQSEVGAQPVKVLGQPSIAHLLEVKDALEDAERMFYFRQHTRPIRVLSVLYLIHEILVFRFAAGHVLSLGSGLLDRLGLAMVSAVVPHLAFLAMQQLGQDA